MVAQNIDSEKLPLACPACGATLFGVESFPRGLKGKYACGSEWLVHVECVKECEADKQEMGPDLPPGSRGGFFCL